MLWANFLRDGPRARQTGRRGGWEADAEHHAECVSLLAAFASGALHVAWRRRCLRFPERDHWGSAALQALLEHLGTSPCARPCRPSPVQASPTSLYFLFSSSCFYRTFLHHVPSLSAVFSISVSFPLAPLPIPTHWGSFD